jgi:hypothetical protein
VQRILRKIIGEIGETYRKRSWEHGRESQGRYRKIWNERCRHTGRFGGEIEMSVIPGDNKHMQRDSREIEKDRQRYWVIRGRYTSSGEEMEKERRMGRAKKSAKDNT